MSRAARDDRLLRKIRLLSQIPPRTTLEPFARDGAGQYDRGLHSASQKSAPQPISKIVPRRTRDAPSRNLKSCLRDSVGTSADCPSRHLRIPLATSQPHTHPRLAQAVTVVTRSRGNWSLIVSLAVRSDWPDNEILGRSMLAAGTCGMLSGVVLDVIKSVRSIPSAAVRSARAGGLALFSPPSPLFFQGRHLRGNRQKEKPTPHRIIQLQMSAGPTFRRARPKHQRCPSGR